MTDKKKQEESIRESDYYLSAVLTNKKSQGNLIPKSYLEQRKRRVNRSTHLFDVRSRSNITESQLHKKGFSLKRCMKIKKPSQICIEQMKITPFQNWKIQEKQTSYKKLTAINKTKDAPKQLQTSKQKWLIIQQLQASSTNLSVQKLLRQQIKRIKLGIQNMRHSIEQQKNKHQNDKNLNINKRKDNKGFDSNKCFSPLFNRPLIVKQKIKRSYFIGKKQQNYNIKIKNHLLKEMYKTNKQKHEFKHLCVSSQKYVLVNPQNNHSLGFIAKATVQSSIEQQKTKHQPIKQPGIQVVNTYLHNSRLLKQTKTSELQVRSHHSQTHSDSLKKSGRQRKLQKVSGWEGANRQQQEKQIYL